MKILIAEDNTDHAVLLEQILSDFGVCVVVSNGVEAVEAFTSAWLDKAPFDLMCLDVLMPKMNGIEALSRIRKLEDGMGIGGFNRMRIVMTTALEEDENIEEAMKAGCDGYVYKSGGGRKLIAQLKTLGLIKD